MVTIEIRKDYLLNRWSILAPERKKRPKEFKQQTEKREASCVFCPGNEKLTPDEIGRIEKNGRWVIRWFTNKFPAVVYEGNPAIRSTEKFFTYADAMGIHEMVIETPAHDETLADLSPTMMSELLKVYAERITTLSKKPGIHYVLVFKNWGMEAGASLVHSHTQIIAYNKVPSLVEEEVAAAKRHGSCPYCAILQKEKKGKRRIVENESFVSFAPYASRFNYEAWLFPKAHIRSITEMHESQRKDLAAMLKQLLLKLKKLDMPYNFYLHEAPAGKDLHWHLELCPRRAIWAGFEFGSGETIISVSPESAAAFYRGETEE